MKRRNFLKFSAAVGLTPKKNLLPLTSDLYTLSAEPNLSKVEARYYKKLPDREIQCHLCPRNCILGDKERGYCGVRENREGTYYTLVYGKAAAVHVDPIEKKPFFHFLPKTMALSIATAGCNVNCKFCQNWEISQVRPEQIKHADLPPEAVVRTAQKYNCPSIAYTYSEPIIFFEYMYDTSLEARKKGIKNLVVTGAHVNPEPFKDLLEVVDGVKIDLKAFSQDFYTEYVRGELQPVLDAIVAASQSRVWLEIVYLVIPTLNDRASEIRQMCRWIKNEIGLDVPLHFSRFYPAYLLKNLPPTPISTLVKLRNIALEEGLHYVYIGNVPGQEGENTFCPHCGKIVIKRTGYLIEKINIKKGKCAFCGHEIPGFWS
jgi:pyruvate formate lyase activating enzyme